MQTGSANKKLGQNTGSKIPKSSIAKKKKIGNSMKKSKNTPQKKQNKPELLELFEKMKRKEIERKEKNEKKKEKEEISENSDSQNYVKKIKEKFESGPIKENLKPKFLSELPKKGSREKERKRVDIPKYDQSSIDFFFKKKERLESPKLGKRKLENTEFEENFGQLHTQKKLNFGRKEESNSVWRSWDN